MKIHELLDWNYGVDGDDMLRRMLAGGVDTEARAGPLAETALHVAARRRRPRAVAILLEAGAHVDARCACDKTAYAHAARRGFDDVLRVLDQHGADASLNRADRFAVAVVNDHLGEARELLADEPSVARTGNPEEDRLLADVAGRHETAPVELLIAAGADLGAPALDGGTPLHQAGWFGQPRNARLLIDAGAPLDVFDPTHAGSPIAWVTHGSRWSGGADERQDEYVALARMLLDAGAALRYPDDPDSGDYRRRLLDEASPRVAEVIRAAVAERDR